MLRALFVLTIFLTLLSPMRAQVVSLDRTGTVNASPFLEILRGNVDTIDAAMHSDQWIANGSGDPNLGIVDETIWFRLRVNCPERSEWVFVIESPVISELDVYRVQNKMKIPFQHSDYLGLGLKTRLQQQKTIYRLPFFSTNVEAGDVNFYFRVRAHQAFRFPLRVMQPETFQRQRDRGNLLYGFFFGALFIMTLYHLSVFFGTREMAYLSYSGLTLSAAFFFFAQQGFAVEIFSSVSEFAMMRFLPLGTTLYCITLGLFAREFLQTGRLAVFDKILKLSIGIAIAILLVIPFERIPFSFFPRANSLNALFIILQVMGIAVYRWRAGYGPAKFFVLAFFSFSAGAVALILEVNGLAPHNPITGYGFHAGVMLQLTLFAFALSDRINLLRQGLEVSEKKYRTLVEDSRDIIFSLDSDFKFITVNEAAWRSLGYSPGALTGKSFYELLYSAAAGTSGIQELIVRDIVSSVSSAPVTFQARLAQRNGEPVMLAFRLEQVGNGRDQIILGRGSASISDPLLEFLKYTRGCYAIANYVTTAELLNRRVTRNLTRYFSTEDADNIEFGLREILANAIEHGNLEISYDEKTLAQKDGSYLDLIAQRQRSPRFRNRKIQVEYSLNSVRSWFRITDEGPGFDHRSMASKETERLQDLQESHGRGIAMTKNMFDLVRYNDRGNQVTLVKYVPAKRNGKAPASLQDTGAID